MWVLQRHPERTFQNAIIENQLITRMENRKQAENLLKKVFGVEVGLDLSVFEVL